MARRAFKIRHRSPAVAKELKLSDKEYKEIVPILREHYNFIGVESKDVDGLIDEAIKASEIGWPRAPKDIMLRLQKKTGYKFVQSKPKPPQVPKAPTNKFGQYTDVQHVLSDEEQVWWNKRISIYIEEFEFNKSSDIAILEQIMVEELLQRRLSIQQLSMPNVDSMISKTQSESLKRLLDLQTKLGITREQRESSMSNIDGNVAAMALALDEKMDEIEKESKKQIAEEEQLQADKDAETPMNILPSQEKLAGILGSEMISLTGQTLNPVDVKITPIHRDGNSQIN